MSSTVPPNAMMGGGGGGGGLAGRPPQFEYHQQQMQQQQFKMPMGPPFTPNYSMDMQQQHFMDGRCLPHTMLFSQQPHQTQQQNMSVNSPSMQQPMMPSELCRPGSSGLGNLPPTSMLIANHQQQQTTISTSMGHFNGMQMMRSDSSSFVGSPPCSAMPQPTMTTECSSSSPPKKNGGLASQQQFNNALDHHFSQQPQQSFVFTTEMLNSAIESNYGGSLADWHATHFCSTQPSTSSAILNPSMATILSHQQQQRSARSPNTNNNNSGGGRGTKRKQPQQQQQHSLATNCHFNIQSQSVPPFIDGKMPQMNDCNAPLSAPDSSISVNGEFRRPSSLSHPPGSVGGGGGNNNYLSPTMAPASISGHFDDNPLKRMEMMTNKCEPMNKISRLTMVNGEGDLNDIKTRSEKLAALQALDQKIIDDQGGMQMEPRIQNGLRTPFLMNGPLPPGHPGHAMHYQPIGGGLPPQMENQMGMHRYPGMPPPNGPGQGHPSMPIQFLQGPNGEMVIPAGMRPPIRMPMGMPPGNMVAYPGGPGGPIISSSQMGPHGMMHSPRFSQPGMPPPQQQINPGASNTPPMFFQQHFSGQAQGMVSQQRIDGNFTPDQNFAQHNGPMIPHNGMMRPFMNPGQGPGRINGEPSPFWPQGATLQPLANLDSRVPVHKMQYTANTPNGPLQQNVMS